MVSLAPSPARSETGATDAVLVAAARAGEAWAKQALFLRHAPRIHGLVFRLLGRDTDVDDLVQDVFVAAFTGLGDLDDPQAFAKWTTSIATRLVCRRVRKKALLRRLGLAGKQEPIDVEAVMGTAAPADVVVELRAIYAILEDLPADERAALVLRRVEGLPLEEVADALGVSLATVKRRVASAEERLSLRIEGGRR
jgi:RNA polymerase sigma-70 factor (ECF subfamily)